MKTLSTILAFLMLLPTVSFADSVEFSTESCPLREDSAISTLREALIQFFDNQNESIALDSFKIETSTVDPTLYIGTQLPNVLAKTVTFSTVKNRNLTLQFQKNWNGLTPDDTVNSIFFYQAVVKNLDVNRNVTLKQCVWGIADASLLMFKGDDSPQGLAPLTDAFLKYLGPKKAEALAIQVIN